MANIGSYKDHLSTKEYVEFLDKWDGDAGNIAHDYAQEYAANPNEADFMKKMQGLVDKILDNIGANGTEADYSELANVITFFTHVQTDDAGGTMLHSHKGDDKILYDLGHAFQGVIYANRENTSGRQGTYLSVISSVDLDPYGATEGDQEGVTSGQELYDKVLAYIKANVRPDMHTAFGHGYGNAGGSEPQSLGSPQNNGITEFGNLDATDLDTLPDDDGQHTH